MEFKKTDANKPNFLIVGAAKAGTTSLAKYLNNHPDVYISKVKEPRFFIADVIRDVSKKDPSYKHLIENSILESEDYYSLFQNKKQKAIGEASVHYLYHYKQAIENIKKHLGENTKIIILLRNPVDRAISNWKYQDKDFLEFHEAINREEDRINEGYNSFWHYTKLGFYYNQVQSYMQNFKNTKVVLFEDFVTNTSCVMRDLYQFLEVDVAHTNEDFKRHNESSLSIVPKKKYLKAFLKNQKRVNAFKKLKSKNIIPERLYLEKEELITEKDKRYLKELYRDDIKKLQKLINQDLSNWL